MTPININTLLDEAKCYACYDPGDVPGLAKLALLSRISQLSATPTGPIAVTGLGTFSSAVFATSYATTVPNALPATNSLLIAVVMAGRDLGVPSTPTVTGAGLTWTLVQSIANGGSNPAISVFRAMGTPTAGFLNVDFGGVSHDCCVVSVHQFTQVNTSGANGSGAIVQSVTAGPTTGTSLAAAMAAFNANGNNAGLFVVARGANPPAVTPKAGWTALLGTGVTSAAHGTQYGVADQYRLATTDNAPSATFGFSTATGIALEIKSVLS